MLPFLRLTQNNDLQQIQALITAAQQLLANDHINQWQDGHPNVRQIQQDITQHASWSLCLQQQVVGTAALINGPDPNYQTLPNNHYHSHEPYAVIHRFTVNPQFSGQQLGRYLMSNLITQAYQQGYQNLRIDTHPDNLRMQHLIEQTGFQKRGDILLLDNHKELRWVYELNLCDKSNRTV